MTTLPPSGAGRLANDYPGVWESYTALGFPAAMAAYSWVNDILEP